MVGCSKSSMEVFTPRKLASTSNHGLGTSPPKEPVVEHSSAPHWVWSWVLATQSFLPHPQTLDGRKVQAANGSKSWYWAPPGGCFKHPSSPTALNPAPARNRKRGHSRTPRRKGDLLPAQKNEVTRPWENFSDVSQVF